MISSNQLSEHLIISSSQKFFEAAAESMPRWTFYSPVLLLFNNTDYDGVCVCVHVIASEFLLFPDVSFGKLIITLS